ncbi:MAG: transglycosylase [Flavobacteriales bacterium BRH_c54]|nr:MAG: transglycosylase [Flavobacteriales bacterium BRH_c54]
MKAAGIILLVIGLIGIIVFGYQAIQDSESFNLLGVDVAVSKADWTPLIISGAMLMLGLIITFLKRK